MMPPSKQNDILSHLRQLGIKLVPNETPVIAWRPCSKPSLASRQNRLALDHMCTLGALVPPEGFAFVHRSLLPKQHALQEPRCFKIESKSCLEGNFGQSQLASRSSEAVHGQRSEIAKSRSKQIAVKSSKPDPLGSLPVCPKSGRSGGNVRGRAFVILNTVQRVSNSVSKSGTLKGFMSHKIAKCSPATCLNTRPDS